MVQSYASPLQEQFTQLRASIDARLANYVEFSRDCPPRLAQAIQYSLLAPGKRLRPVLVLMAAEAVGGDVESALPAACAVEMVHAYSLIHDDLPAMDDDDLRRGRPTCHRQFDEAHAILAGDALLTLAFEVLAKEIRPGDVAARCCATLAEAAGAVGMVGGQADDIAGRLPEGGLARLEAIHRRKTGAMFLASLRLGAIVAGGDHQQQAALERYGTALGMAFQIVDDLIDVAGDEQLAGKRLNKDGDQGKLTFPGLLGIDASRRRARELVEEACGALAPLGTRASSLQSLARYVLERKH